MVLLAPGEMPAQAESSSYVAAAAAFEGANAGRTALPAWEAAFERWPGSDDALFAFGNALLTAGEGRSAEQCYAALLARSPDHVGARNNLAMLLAERGCARAARATLAPALEAAREDPAWHAVLQASSEEIDALPEDAAHCANARATPAEVERAQHGVSCAALDPGSSDLARER
jgi:predicted Zn-dependent protease